MVQGHKQKGNPTKLARQLQPNQSIRSDQKKSSKSKTVTQHGPSNSSEPTNFIDCSLRKGSENEVILNTLIQVIDFSHSTTKSKEKIKTRHQRNVASSNAIDLELKNLEFNNSRIMAGLIGKNQAPFFKNQRNNYFILGLNSILSYLENLRFILIQIEELIKLSHPKIIVSSSTCNNPDFEPNHFGPINSDNNQVNEMTGEDKFEHVLKDLKIIKYIIIFNNHFNNQHHLIIDLISTLIKQINPALFLLTSSVHRSNPHNFLTEKSIELIGFPVDYVQPILKRFGIRKLSCFAILDSAPGLEKLTGSFKNE